ncbi:MAG: leucine-rich repeat protein [Syntrophomonas sp.]
MGFLSDSKVKIIFFSTVVMAILLCCSNPAQAEQEGDYTYTISGSEATIIKYTGTGGAVTIPSILGGSSVTSIEYNAFYGCTNITSVSIPEGITCIGNNAFYYCTSLSNVYIPASVTSIGSGAFGRCPALTSITADNSNSMYKTIDNVLYNKAGTTLEACPGSLTSLTIPESVTNIADWAISWCEALTNITIPESVTTIGRYNFHGCRSLTSISIPQGVTSIGVSAFSWSPGLNTILVDKNNQYYSSIGGALYNKDGTVLMACPGGLTSFTIPQGVTNIDYQSFGGCWRLTSIIIPQGVTSIGKGAFQECTGLTNIDIPAGVTGIGMSAFRGCTALTSITFNSALTTIYDSEDTIPATTKIIGHNPSNAKDYADKYSRTFETIGSACLFTDPNLEAAIREELGKPEGDLTAADLEGICELSIFGRGITSLEGIQNLKNLKGLYAWDNPITDISPLKTLTQLQWLDLDEVQVSDYSPLQYLTSLENLSLAFNNVSNQLDDILGSMTNLLSLNLKSNNLGDSEYANNSRHLASTEGNHTSSLMGELGKLTHLNELNLSSNAITSIEGLQTLKELSSLNISNNQMSDLSPLQNLSNLRSLSASDNLVSDITPLENLTNLTELDLSSNQVTNISPLSTLTKVSSINLSDNRINDVEALGGLNAASTIYLSGNQIEDYSAVETLPNVEQFTSDAGTINTTDWYTQTDVAIDKTWQVKFNRPIKTETVNNENVYVKDPEGRKCPVEVIIGSDSCTINVKPPAAGYLPGQSYYLYITDKVQSQSGQSIKDPIKMQFSIADNQTAGGPADAAHKPQGLVDDVFLVKDLIVFSYGLNNLVDRVMDDVNYLRQLPEDHFIAEQMDEAYSYANWRQYAEPLYSTDSILSTYNYLFGKNTCLGDVSSDKFLQDLNDLIKNIGTALSTKTCSWWMTEPLKPITDAGKALGFIADWNKIKDGKIVLGKDLKIGGDKVFKIGENNNRLSLTMIHKPKWELKYLLGTPSQEVPVGMSEQARWVSSDPTVAKVYKGKVTGYKPGKTTISVRYYNKKATWEITVK